MSHFTFRLMLGAGAIALLIPSTHAAVADIPHPKARTDMLLSVENLVQPKSPRELPADLVHPFNPTAFGQPDEQELAAIAAAKAAEAASQNKAMPANEADVLERLAERVAPSGTLMMNDEAYLIFGQKRLRVGDRLTVRHDAKDYNLEITAIQRLTYTLRLNRAEITRRINPGKNP